MTSKVLECIANETNGKYHQSFRYCADDEIKIPTLDYDDKDRGKEFTLVKNSCRETDTSLKTTKDIRSYAKKIINDAPLFQFFLDGSRRTYKVDDIEINRNVYPIIAGQIGVACCQRQSPDKFKCAGIKNFSNYILYNFNDKPEDFYKRLRLMLICVKNCKSISTLSL